MKVTAKIFLESDDDYIVGPGRVELLRTIEELGSLRKAAEKLGMSYRWAWGRLKNAEQELGVPLMMRTTKKIGGKPNMLTEQAKILLQWYDRVEEAVQTSLELAQDIQPDFLKNRYKSRQKRTTTGKTKE